VVTTTELDLDPAWEALVPALRGPVSVREFTR
jgi:hypothetical protein